MKLQLENPTFNITINHTSAGLPPFGAALLSAFMQNGTSKPGASPAAAPTSAPPEIGEYWHGQGGFYAGDMRSDDGTVYGLILADCDVAKDAGRAAWGPEGQLALSDWDGLANTLALGGEYPAAKLAAGHAADGHEDFYLPARRELQLACATVPHLFGADGWYWSSTPRTESFAWAVDFENGRTNRYDRSNEFRVRPVRRFVY